MRQRPPESSSILDAASYELRFLLAGILLPAILASFVTYVIIAFVDADRTGIYNSIPSSIILILGTIVALRLLFSTSMEKKEIRRFRVVFLTIILWTIGELIYVYHQAFLGIAVPYPSVADIFYLSATILLSIHLYTILSLKRHILKANYLLYLGFIASAFPIYLLFDNVYNYEQYYPDFVLEFLVNSAYYITDAVAIFPCIPIILSMRRKDPFVFHWLLITLSVFVLVLADLGYTFVATVDDELLQNTEWLWSFVYSIGYVLLTVSVIWFSRIKAILDYKKFSDTLRNRPKDDTYEDIAADAPVTTLENQSQVLGTITSLLEKAEENIDILFVRNFIQHDDMIKIISKLTEIIRRNKLLHIRIILPSSEPRYEIPSNHDPRILVKYFDRQMSSDSVTLILDYELVYIMGSESENPQHHGPYFVQNVTNEIRKGLHNVLFEKMWMIEKPMDFG